MSPFARIRSLIMIEAFHPDIALSRDEASRFLPWIIALMVYLAALTLAGSFTLHKSISAQHTAQVESFSVHLPRPGDKAQEMTDKALDIIHGTPGVKEAAEVTTGRIREMVEPWFGKGDALENLPLPIIIEAKLESDATVDYDALKARLNALAPGAEIDNHKAWITQFSNLVHAVQWVLFTIAVMIIGASAAVVIFACKTSLKIHRGTVALLHRLGALDDYIAGQFQHHAALLALKGAFVGSGFAAGTLVGLHLMAQHIDSPLFPSFALSGAHWLILLGLPVFMSVIALTSARTSVLAALGKDAVKLALIDRDGVLNEDRPDYVKSPQELVLLPHAAEAVSLLRKNGFTCVVITNQAVVGRGIIDQKVLDAIHAKLRDAVKGIEEIIFCTDHPDRPTVRRKPGTGMLLEALAKYGADAAKTPMIGDTVTDMLAANAAGCPRYLVMTGKGRDSAEALPANVAPVTLCADILDATRKIIDSGL